MTTQAKYVEATPDITVDRRYLTKREIARGAMGVVFESQHLFLRQTLALKTLSAAALAWNQGTDRLLREACALALCRHPNIVQAVDAGVCPTHGPFLAMEMLDGRTLGSILLARQRLSVAQLTSIALQLGAALDCIHEAGVLHRDLKPGNVVVLREDGGGGDVLKVIDFGIASVPGAEDVVTRKLTGAGEVLGTPEYMAPEVLVDASPWTRAADVYAFGVLLYECLAGDVPLPGTLTAVTTALVKQTKPRPLSELRADVPEALDAVIRSALDQDPLKRPSTAGALAKGVATATGLSGPLRLESAEVAPVVQRVFVRVPYAAPVRIVRGDGRSLDGRTEDISEGGILVLSDAPLESGERVQVRLPLPTSGRVATFDATARWGKGNRGRHALGLSFASLEEAHREDIRTYAHFMTVGRG